MLEWGGWECNLEFVGLVGCGVGEGWFGSEVGRGVGVLWGKQGKAVVCWEELGVDVYDRLCY